MSAGRPKGESQARPVANVLTLYTAGTWPGINGELAWPRLPPQLLGKGTASPEPVADPIQVRRDLLALHTTSVQALADMDADALAATMHDGVQSAVRDYVADTGALAQLEGKPANRAYYAAFFEKFEVVGVDLLDRVVQDWYVFAELRMTVQPRGGGAPSAFHVAEYFIPANDGRFIVRIGYGTDLASLT